MAMNQKQQLIVIAIGVVVAGYMGYTTLFPNVTSKYATQNNENAPQLTTSNDLLHASTEVALAPPTLTDSDTSSAEPKSGLSLVVENALLEWSRAPKVSQPLKADVQSETIIAQSKSITDATMKAKLREQNQRHQVEKNTHESLGINAPMAASTQTSGSAEPKATSYPVYLFRMADGPTIARIQYQGQWIKVHPGMELGTIKVLRITSKGVTVRESGNTRLLTPRDS